MTHKGWRVNQHNQSLRTVHVRICTKGISLRHSLGKFATLWVYSEHDSLVNSAHEKQIFFLFFLANRLWRFMYNLHQTSKPIFWKKKKTTNKQKTKENTQIFQNVVDRIFSSMLNVKKVIKMLARFQASKLVNKKFTVAGIDSASRSYLYNYLTHIKHALTFYDQKRLTFTTLWANSAYDKLMVFFYFLPENRIWHFIIFFLFYFFFFFLSPMVTICNDMSNPVFWKKY